MELFLKFFRIISAVILFKLTGYGLMFVLFIHKVEISWTIKSIAILILSLNIYLIWLSFRLQKKFPWVLVIAASNLAIVGRMMKDSFSGT